jgi:hypothetical protein
MKRNRTLVIAVVAGGVAATLYFMRQPEGESDILQISGNVGISDVEASFKVPGRVLVEVPQADRALAVAAQPVGAGPERVQGSRDLLAPDLDLAPVLLRRRLHLDRVDAGQAADRQFQVHRPGVRFRLRQQRFDLRAHWPAGAVEILRADRRSGVPSGMFVARPLPA